MGRVYIFVMNLMKSVVSLRYDFYCSAIGWRILSMQAEFLWLTYEERKHTQEQPFSKPAKYALSKCLSFYLIRVNYDY